MYMHTQHGDVDQDVTRCKRCRAERSAPTYRGVVYGFNSRAKMRFLLGIWIRWIRWHYAS